MEVRDGVWAVYNSLWVLGKVRFSFGIDGYRPNLWDWAAVDVRLM